MKSLLVALLLACAPALAQTPGASTNPVKVPVSYFSPNYEPPCAPSTTTGTITLALGTACANPVVPANGGSPDNWQFTLSGNGTLATTGPYKPGQIFIVKVTEGASTPFTLNAPQGWSVGGLCTGNVTPVSYCTLANQFPLSGAVNGKNLFTCQVIDTTPTIWCPSVSSGLTATTALPPGFFVATNGNDSNAGTLAAPFATLGQCQTAMQGSSTKTCYIRAGTYQPAKQASADGFLCNHHYSNGVMAGAAIFLQAADAGETWSYYPPDGAGSAIIDGQSTVGESSDQEHGSIIGGPANGLGCIFSAQGVNNITITGLQLERAVWAGFFGWETNTVTLSNNTVHDITGAVFNGGSLVVTDGTNFTVTNNYIHDVQYIGIGGWTSAIQGSMTGQNFSGNVIINSCLWPPHTPDNDETGNDCGAIYEADQATTIGSSTNRSITNNYVRDVNAPSNATDTSAFGIYLDAASSHTTVSGNVVAGKMTSCFDYHGGSNNAVSNNLCDMDNTSELFIIYYAGCSGCDTGMTSTSFHNNIVVSSASGGGNGFRYDSPSGSITPTTNFYHNYVGSAIVTTGDGAGGNADANPISGDPQITCWDPVIAGGSPVFNAPNTGVSFTALTKGWGPPGFVMPQTGTAPSWPHAC